MAGTASRVADLIAGSIVRSVASSYVPWIFLGFRHKVDVSMGEMVRFEVVRGVRLCWTQKVTARTSLASPGDRPYSL